MSGSIVRRRFGGAGALSWRGGEHEARADERVWAIHRRGVHRGISERAGALHFARRVARQNAAVRRELAHNQRAWDERVRRQDRHTRTVLARDLQNPLPVLDPENWLGGNVRGRKVLCLASGGGLQSGLLAAAGAVVTVVDLSGEMLNQDRAIAAKYGFQVLTVQASMEDLSMFPAGSFEVAMQPVSTCYVPDIGAVFREVARVLKDGGVYISQHKQPASLQAETLPGPKGYTITEPANRGEALPPATHEAKARRGSRLTIFANTVDAWRPIRPHAPLLS